MTSQRVYPLLIAVIATVVLFSCLGSTHLWDEDEGYFASAAAEMYARGDWIVPYFNGEMFGHKPPWMYWMMMTGFSLFGVNELAARFFSAVFGVATALLTYQLGRRLFNPRVGFYAGLIMPTCIMFSVVSRAATPDVFLVFFAALSLYIFAVYGFGAKTNEEGRAGEQGKSIHDVLPHRWATFAGMYAIMGLAVLVKGPIGFLFPMAVIGLFLLFMTPRRAVATDAPRWKKWLETLRPFGPVNFVVTVWRMRPFTAIAMILLVAGPWYAAVGVLTEGEFLKEFFGVHHFKRATTAMDAHSGSIFYYIPAILVGIFPWSMFAGSATWEWVKQLQKRDAGFPALVFMGCWVGVYVGIFSLASTKLPNYVLPAYPALAVILALFIDVALRSVERRHVFGMKQGYLVLVVVGVVILAGLPIAGTVEFDGQTLLDRANLTKAAQSEMSWIGMIGLPLVIGGLAAFILARFKRFDFAMGTGATTAVATLIALWILAAPRVDQFQSPQRLAQSTGFDPAANARVAALGCFRPSMAFYAQQPIHLCKSADDVKQFIAQTQASYLITNESGYEKLGEELRREFEIVEQKPDFPKPGKLLLLKPTVSLAQRPEHAQQR